MCTEICDGGRHFAAVILLGPWMANLMLEKVIKQRLHLNSFLKLVKVRTEEIRDNRSPPFSP